MATPSISSFCRCNKFLFFFSLQSSLSLSLSLSQTHTHTHTHTHAHAHTHTHTHQRLAHYASSRISSHIVDTHLGPTKYVLIDYSFRHHFTFARANTCLSMVQLDKFCPTDIPVESFSQVKLSPVHRTTNRCMTRKIRSYVTTQTCTHAPALLEGFSFFYRFWFHFGSKNGLSELRKITPGPL